jgi:hypothetical protein
VAQDPKTTQETAAWDAIHEDTHRWGADSLEASLHEEDIWKQWANRWFWLSVVLVCALVVVSLWDHVDRRKEVEPFVQTLKESADGQVIMLQPAKPLREYILAPEGIQFMLTRLVVDLRRLSVDATVNQDSRRNVLASVCGPASQTIATPAVRDAEIVVVNVESIHAGASPRTWHGEWSELWYDKQLYAKGEHLFRSDFTLARRDLDWKQKDSMAIFARNPVALCLQHVTIYKVPVR